MNEMTEKQKSLVAGFKWDEDEDEGNETQPESVLAMSVFDCAKKIHQYVVDNMALELLAGDDTIEVPVPASLDPLLEARYDDIYTKESRLAVFDLLRAAFRFKLDEVGFQTADKINQLLPQQNEKVDEAVKAYVEDMNLSGVVSSKGGIKRTIHVIRCDLHDEPSMDVIVTQKVGDKVVDAKTDSSRQCICAEITFESRRNS